ncbi:MAG: glycoside hydrolase family 92 protein, partial [Candidatus Thermoplasmatota archaeon]|nr:glycoside hydrolase family 92 protein [Candidatus Thermoplasmatota archaeon]
MSGICKCKAIFAIGAAALFFAVAFSGCMFGLFEKKAPATAESPKDFASYADPMIGTDFNGHTFPGATAPFGMVQLSPDTNTTGWNHCSGYNYSDKTIMGFSHTHLSGTGCADYGDILVMPEVGDLQIVPGDESSPESGYRSKFSHANESAEPGYYSVKLDDNNVFAELTATTRVGIHRYTFPASQSAHVIIDLSHGMAYADIGTSWSTDAQVSIVDDTTIEGYRGTFGWAPRHVVYFVMQFSKPFASYGAWNDMQTSAGSSGTSGRCIGAYADFQTSANESIVVKV